ncbi:MAG: GntR family transcriptional regulator [Casimicrobiaceae bacterium]|nr:GntR family transcriptional regulator [Casimicrobiaceae bacterium]
MANEHAGEAIDAPEQVWQRFLALRDNSRSDAFGNTHAVARWRFLTRTQGVLLNRRVYEALMSQLASGELKRAQAIPPERKLAQQFAVSASRFAGESASGSKARAALLRRTIANGCPWISSNIVPHEGEKTDSPVECVRFRKSIADAPTAKQLRADRAPHRFFRSTTACSLRGDRRLWTACGLKQRAWLG